MEIFLSSEEAAWTSLLEDKTTWNRNKPNHWRPDRWTNQSSHSSVSVDILDNHTPVMPPTNCNDQLSKSRSEQLSMILLNLKIMS